METMETLGERLRLGDKGVITAILTNLAPAITAIVRRVAKGKYSEDISQDVLLHLTGALSRVQLVNSNVKLWVLTKAHYLALDYLRAYRRGDHPYTEVSEIEHLLGGAYSSESCEASEIVHSVLAEFDPDTQEIIRLHMEDYTFSEIAEQVGRTKSQVYHDYRKFGDRCKRLIGA